MSWRGLLVALLLVPSVHAEEAAPDALVKRVSDEVILAIRQQKDARSLVEAKILPHFDARAALRLRTHDRGQGRGERRYRCDRSERAALTATEIRASEVGWYCYFLSPSRGANLRAVPFMQ